MKEKHLKRVLQLKEKYFNSEAMLKRWSMEALAEEDELQETTEYETSDMNEDFNLDDDGFAIDRVEENAGIDLDSVPSMDDLDGESYEEGDESQDVELSMNADEKELVNIMELSGTLMNTYLKSMGNVLKINKNCIEYTGNFKENPMYEKFVEPARKILVMYSKETQLEKKIDNFMNVLLSKKLMSSIVGTKSSPFIYESLQLLCIEGFRELLAVLPVSIKNSCSIEDAISKFGYTHIAKLVESMEDVVEISGLFGEKIYFMEPDEAKELSGTNEAINGTPFAQNAAFESMIERYDFTLPTKCATESILNLIEIRNNKSLLEFSLIMKMCIFISGLAEDVNLNSSCNSVLDKVNSILTMDTTKDGDTISAAVDEVIASLRTEIIMPQLNKMVDIVENTDTDIENTK